MSADTGSSARFGASGATPDTGHVGLSTRAIREAVEQLTAVMSAPSAYDRAIHVINGVPIATTALWCLLDVGRHVLAEQAAEAEPLPEWERNVLAKEAVERQAAGNSGLRDLVALMQQELELARSGDGYEEQAVAEEIVSKHVAPLLVRERSSRQDWAVEAMRLDVELGRARALVARLCDATCYGWPGWNDEHHDPIKFAEVAADVALLRRSHVDELTSRLRQRNREYGRASHTIGVLRGQLARRDYVPGAAGERVRAASHHIAHQCEATQAAIARQTETPSPTQVRFQIKHSDQCTVWIENKEAWLTGTVLQRYDGRTIIRAGNYRFAHTVFDEHVYPATGGPRVWQQGDPEPFNIRQVHDVHGDVWTKVGGGTWESPETTPCSWDYIVKKWAPVTEVVENSPVGIPKTIVTSGDPQAAQQQSESGTP